MNINERVDLLIQLGEYFVMNDESLQSAKQKAKAGNGWFSIDFIDLALENITKNFFYGLLVRFDAFRQFMGSKWVKRIAVWAGVIFCGIIIYRWLSDADTKWSDVAPEFIGSIFLTIVALGRKK